MPFALWCVYTEHYQEDLHMLSTYVMQRLFLYSSPPPSPKCRCDSKLMDCGTTFGREKVALLANACLTSAEPPLQLQWLGRFLGKQVAKVTSRHWEPKQLGSQ